VLAGLTSGTRTGHIARAALDSIAWRVADVLAAVSATVSVDVLRVDGGLTRDPLLLRLQADATGVPVTTHRRRRHRRRRGALAAVGVGLWPSTREIAERVPTGEWVEPRRDAAWRERAHEEWREFVQTAAEL
jgi:glycerol kinase